MIAEGIYPDLPEAEYRADGAINQSLLKEFGEAATPLHFQKRKPRKPTADMEFGTVCHAAIITPELLHTAYHLRPDTYPAEVKGKKVVKEWNGNSDWCKDWLMAHGDRPILTHAQVAKIGPILDRVLKLPEFSSALENGQTEVACFKWDVEFEVMLKCRVDLMATDANGETWVFDLKKVQTGCATESEFAKQSVNLGYDIQAASYLAITGATHFVFVPFDDDEPFDAIQWRPDAEFLARGRERWRALLSRYVQCVKSGSWPGYPAGLNTLRLPEWARK